MIERLEERMREALAHPDLAASDLARVCEALLEERTRLLQRVDRIMRISDVYQAQLLESNHALTATNAKLSEGLAGARSLPDLLPICYCCKRIRDEQGAWDEVESYLGAHTDATLSQGICPDCIQEGMTTLSLPRRTHKVRGGEDERRRLEALLTGGIAPDNPLLLDHLELSRRYSKMARRLDKISKISDGFQSQLKELNSTLERASLTDTLTGIANRRAMLERLRAEANRTDRGGSPFCVLMLDLDHFKRVNDTYGHEAGDLVILAVAQTLENSLRNFDFCARWGGEEFLVLLTTTTTDTATGVAEKLRQAVAAHEVTYEGQRLAISFSGGIAQHNGEANVNETLRDADRALYEAKAGGRNRVVTAESLS